MPEHRCRICNKTLSRSTKLSEHMRSHTGERPFKCPTCGTTFSRSYDLTKHKELHSGSYKYRCSFEENGITRGCGKGFHKKGDLNRHLRRDNADQCRQHELDGDTHIVEGSHSLDVSREETQAQPPRGTMLERLQAAVADHSRMRNPESEHPIQSPFKNQTPPQKLQQPYPTEAAAQPRSISPKDVMLDSPDSRTTEVGSSRQNTEAAAVLAAMKDDQFTSNSMKSYTRPIISLVVPPGSTHGPVRLVSPPGSTQRPPSPGNAHNAHSLSGFDVLGVLERVATRKSPTVNIGPVDMSCAFVVCDLLQEDSPIVYCSDMFEQLTGYSRHEVMGRNCRFLQAPDGKVKAGDHRLWTNTESVKLMKQKIDSRAEGQILTTNFRKGGERFGNLLTLIPITWDTAEYKYCVGFLIDYHDGFISNSIKVKAGKPFIDYTQKKTVDQNATRGPQSHLPENETPSLQSGHHALHNGNQPVSTTNSRSSSVDSFITPRWVVDLSIPQYGMHPSLSDRSESRADGLRRIDPRDLLSPSEDPFESPWQPISTSGGSSNGTGRLTEDSSLNSRSIPKIHQDLRSIDPVPGQMQAEIHEPPSKFNEAESVRRPSSAPLVSLPKAQDTGSEWQRPPNILLVDDDAICRDVGVKFLSSLGCAVDIAVDGLKAVEMLRDNRKFDLIFMDIIMPNLDGVSACHTIRQFDQTPIISMTSNIRADDITMYFQHGMNDVLPKPFTRMSMRSMLEKHLYHLLNPSTADENNVADNITQAETNKSGPSVLPNTQPMTTFPLPSIPLEWFKTYENAHR